MLPQVSHHSGTAASLSTSSYYSSSLAETNLFAKKLAEAIGPCAIISLEGPLGAGKTHLVKALALALGIDTPVTSPTFTLIQSYEKQGGISLHHFDFYRLKNRDEAIDLGLNDYFQEGICVIEWGNKFPELLPAQTIRISIEPLSEYERIFSWNSAITLPNAL